MLAKGLAALTESYKQNPIPSLKQRLNQLNRLEKSLKDNKQAVIEAVDLDFNGRASKETSLYEIIPALEEIRHARHNLKKWLKPDKRRPSLWLQGGSSYVQAIPKGIVGIMVPWNYPIYLAFGPLVAAFAAGNKVMLKLSEGAPNTAKLLQAILKKLFSPEELIVITGDVKVSQAFSKLPLDHLLFTGSTTVGYHILNDAAKTMKPVTLELGGKSPVVIGKTASLSKACRRIITGKLINAGQTCVAPDYVLMQQNQIDDFIVLAQQYVKQLYPSLFNNTNYTSIINQRQFDRLQSIIDDAKLQGATLIPLSEDSNKEKLNNLRFMPYIILNTTKDMLVMQQEIFGPLLPVIITSNIKQAIDFINQDEKPLALYYFGYDTKEQQQLLEHTSAGGVTLNGVITHVADPSLPFGGIGKSGMGNYHAKEGFDTFSHQRAIFKQSSLSSLDYISAPYNKLSDLAEYLLTHIDLKSWSKITIQISCALLTIVAIFVFVNIN